MYGIFIDDERNVEDVTWIFYPEGVMLECARCDGIGRIENG